jgi:transcriptional regulator with XRE-family HTH domain
MGRHRTKRKEASNAVVALRKLLGVTQQQFASEVLKVAISSVARWETKDPPHGETLIQLADIAERNGVGLHHTKGQPFMELGSVFRRLYLDEVRANLGGGQIIGAVETETRPGYAYLFVKLEGADQIKAAREFLLRLPGGVSC